LSTLLDRDSLIWSIGAAITQPLFDAGRNHSNVERARAAFNENLATYQERLLVAFQEVENTLSGLSYSATAVRSAIARDGQCGARGAARDGPLQEWPRDRAGSN
jgi:outer membrane protein TolC